MLLPLVSVGDRQPGEREPSMCDMKSAKVDDAVVVVEVEVVQAVGVVSGVWAPPLPPPPLGLGWLRISCFRG